MLARALVLAASLCSVQAFLSPATPQILRHAPLSSLPSREGVRVRSGAYSLSPVMLVGVPKQVLVTGASGRTGFLVFKKMREMESEFFVKGFVRDDKGAKKLETTGATTGDSDTIKEQNAKLRAMGMPADDEDPEIYVGDICGGTQDLATLGEAMQDCDAVVIATSAVPKLRKREIVKTILSKLIGKKRMPKFYYNQMPEEVDWVGCKNQIDLAKEKGVEHVVLVSSMGVSPRKNTPDAMLNQIGDGNILMWKAKAEEYLMKSGLDYTIIHPGGLTDKQGGERQLLLGVNDELLDNFESLGALRSIPRDDVAELVIQSIRYKDLVAKKSFDAISKDVGKGLATKDFESLFKSLP